MKRLIIGLLLLIPSSARAVDLTIGTTPESALIVPENTTVTIASAAATVIIPSGRYMEIQLSPNQTTFYYRIDGTTTSVQSTGMYVSNGSTATIKVINGNPLALQNVAGGASQTLRAVKISR